jgi:hypothetical protein
MLLKIIFYLLFGFISLLPQNKDSLYFISVNIGGGYLRYITSLDYQSLDQNGFCGSFRIMWHPEHQLSIGVETGYQKLYSINPKITVPEFGTSDVRASMISVPIFITFSMKILPESLPNFQVLFSPGIFILLNRGEAFNDQIKSSQISNGFSAGVSYLYPVTDLLSIGSEVKYAQIAKIQDSDITIQLMLSYKFLQW